MAVKGNHLMCVESTLSTFAVLGDDLKTPDSVPGRGSFENEIDKVL